MSVSTVGRVRLSGRIIKRRRGGGGGGVCSRAGGSRKLARLWRSGLATGARELRTKLAPHIHLRRCVTKEAYATSDRTKRRNRTRHESRSTRLLRSRAVYKSARVVIRKPVTGRCPRGHGIPFIINSLLVSSLHVCTVVAAAAARRIGIAPAAADRGD